MPERIPVWLMRQAGRYLPEYREIRQQAAGFLELCYTPALATEITLQPIRRYGFDAAILFSDILVLPDALGQKVWFEEGIGPRLEPVTREAPLGSDALDHLQGAGQEKLTAVYEAVERTRVDLPADCTLIGFAGSPWTVATYMIEGGTSRGFERIRQWAVSDPSGFGALLDILVEATSRHLIGQIEAGAEAVQLFESHAGVLDADGFERWVVAPNRAIVHAVRKKFPDFPIIGFPRGAGVNISSYIEKTGVNVVGLDQTVPLGWAARHVQSVLPVQGNLDPIYLLSDNETILRQVHSILEAFSEGPHIFNLGHGVIKETDPQSVDFLVKTVREYRR